MSKELDEHLQDIKRKCEQYWNEPGPFLPEEVHSILEYIFREANKAEKEIAVLKTELESAEEFVEMAGYASNSGDDEYSPTCQECYGLNHHHANNCRLQAWLHQA